MISKKAVVPKEEIQEMAEVLAVFRKLPPTDRIAITYYIKGRIDALAADIEIPVGIIKEAAAY